VTDSLAPTLLVAMPQLLDPNFRRAVVLLLHHDPGGTFGLVMNRDADISAEGLCSTLDVEWTGDPDALVRWGGPVQPNTGWVLVGDDEVRLPEAIEVSRGLAWAGSVEVLRRVAAEPPRRMQIFLGYSGWGPGQLEQELAQGAWLLAPLHVDVVFDTPPEDMWERVLAELGIDPATLVSTPGVH
jgi:putative transcriptional regulator